MPLAGLYGLDVGITLTSSGMSCFFHEMEPFANTEATSGIYGE